MRNKFILISAAFILISFGASLPLDVSRAQEKPKLNKKKQELQQLRGNIKLYQTKIEESSRKESTSLGTLDKLEKQNLQTRQTIKQISNQIAESSRNVSNIEMQINQASFRLSDLTNEYASLARGFYKQGRMHDLELVLTASSMNEMLVRYEYLKRFTDQTKLDMSSISSERDRLSVLKEQLRQQLSQQQEFLDRKNTEETKLSSRIITQKDVIGKLRKDKSNYAEQLKRSQTAAAELDKLIQNLIAEEAERKRLAALAAAKKAAAAAAATASTKKQPELDTKPTAVPTDFSAKKGLLPWPVSKGRVVQKYGEQENPVLKTVTLNYGIDIAVPENAEVKTVANGEVSRIFWLPSYGNLIIIDNYNGLRTVYSHLSDIFVKEGDKVKAGEPVGAVGESLGGSILHFEVWLDKDKQDPETWLSKK